MTDRAIEILRLALDYARSSTLEEDQVPAWVEEGERLLAGREIIVVVEGGNVSMVHGIPEGMKVTIRDYDNGATVDPFQPLPDDCERDDNNEIYSVATFTANDI